MRHDLRKLDLGLLMTLDALLETGSTIESAERLGRTQSAVSHALNRLREIFGDPLFVRKGWALEPTPRATALRNPVARLLSDAAGLLDEPDGFSPATSRRTFCIAAPDFCIQLFAPAVTQAGQEAPGLSFSFERIEAGSFDRLLKNDLDLVVAPNISSLPAGLEKEALTVLDWAVFCRAGHAVGSPLMREAWLSHPHVQVRTPAGSRSPVDDAVASLGLSRMIGARVPDFLSAFAFVANGDALFTAPLQPFERLAEGFGLKRLRCPIELPTIPLFLYRNAARTAEPAMAWLMEAVVRPAGEGRSIS